MPAKTVFRTTRALETKAPPSATDAHLQELVGLSAGLGPLALAEVTSFARRAAELANQNAVADQVAEQYREHKQDFEEWLTACCKKRVRSTGDPDLDVYLYGKGDRR